MTPKNLYLVNNKLPETAIVSYYDVESDQNLTQEEYQQIYPKNNDEIIIINKSGSNFTSDKEGCGPCSYSGCPYSSPFEIEIFIEGISRKWARNHGTGSFLACSWEWSPTNSYLYRNDLWMTDIDQARKVIPLIVNDKVWTTNLWVEYCMEDGKLCNAALRIIRECIKYHELGCKIEVRETLDSDVSKWSEWGLKVGISVGTSFVNPAAVVAIGAGSWGAGKIGEEICDSDRGKAFWGTIGGIGKDTLKGAAWGAAANGVGTLLGASGKIGLGGNVASEAAKRAAGEYFIVDGMKIFADPERARMIAGALHGAKVLGDAEMVYSLFEEAGYVICDAREHINHVKNGHSYKSGCGVCDA